MNTDSSSTSRGVISPVDETVDGEVGSRNVSIFSLGLLTNDMSMLWQEPSLAS